MNKSAKEAFVTGHTGSTVFEILLVCISAPVGLFCYLEISHYLQEKKNVNSISIAVALESLTILLPMAINQTIYLHPVGITVMIAMFTIASILCWRRRNRIEKYSELKFTEIVKETKNDLDFLTYYRSTVSYLTFVAILAVDFPIFPRSFAKTEVAGYGLMDIGAGSFALSGGFVSWYARRSMTKKEAERPKLQTEMKRFRKVIMRSIPLIIMGFLRLLTTKGLDYQEHVSEYGVHWNFFFTLTATGLLSTFFRGILGFRSPAVWITLGILYQTYLTFYGGQDYIENAPRYCENHNDSALAMKALIICNLFAANREGILGSIGYLIFHLIGEDIGHYCLWSCNGNVSQTSISKSVQGRRLFSLTIFAWIVHYTLISTLDIYTSRRSTNSSFIAWTISHNLTILSLTWLSFGLGTKKEKIKTDKNPPLFAAVNRHGLLVFILANLMTGAVNLTVDTINSSDSKSVFIIFCYLCAVGAVALFLDKVLDKKSTKGKPVKKE
ncbi:hypothetical protein CTEN210_04600 [Chaetoceros tenuissimus]|uniref:GPI-anchored wall transfer protein n=1 Tax=Chaetoceros tenuissimus TaxID=426638 RepID=A0AAD3H331_9STRA|nr:hypothetical protein CTEN210_04600 [Chaetoceros tenuissimus]